MAHVVMGYRQDILRTAVACVVLLSTQCCDALVTEGSVPWRAKATTFIAKFCYTFNPEQGHRAGTLNLTIHAPAEARHLGLAYMMLFDDEDGSYGDKSSEWLAMSCHERLRHTRDSNPIKWGLVSQPFGQSFRIAIRQKVRPRWWYVALADCSGAASDLQDIQVQFKASLVNDSYGWASEFSTDKRYVLLVVGALACVYSCLAAAQLVASRIIARDAKDDRARGKAAHPFARILVAGISFALGETIFSAMHLARFAQNGVGLPIMQVLAQLMGWSSNFLLASLLLLVSQGKCVSYVMVASDAWKMLRLLGPFSISCFSLELWAEYSLSRNYTTDYVYTTPLGWALILIDLFFLVVYLRNLRKTFEAECDRDDGIFYRTWGLLYGAWFLALPITAVLAQAVLAPYAWFMVSLSVKKGATALVYAALVVGLWPGNTLTYFKLEVAVNACSAAAEAWYHGSRLSPDVAVQAGKPVALPSLFGSFTQSLPGAKLQLNEARKSSLGMSP